MRTAAVLIAAALLALLLLLVGRDPTHLAREPLRHETRATAYVSAFESAPSPSNATPWQMFYGLWGHGKDFQIQHDDGAMSCLNWLLTEATWKPVFAGSSISTRINGDYLFLGDMEPGRPKGLEGHFCQFLFILSRVEPDVRNAGIHLPPDGARGTLDDYVRGARREISGASDLSWALPMLIRWRGPTRWENRFGEPLSLDTLTEETLGQESRSIACGGTHWRYAIAACVAEGRPYLTPAVYGKVRTRHAALVQEAKASLQAGVGFTPPSRVPSRDVFIAYQAHTLEWLLLNDAIEPWIEEAVGLLLAELERPDELSYATRCHVTQALRSYLRRGGVPTQDTGSRP